MKDVSSSILDFTKYERNILSTRAAEYRLLAEKQAKRTGEHAEYGGLVCKAKSKFNKYFAVRTRLCLCTISDHGMVDESLSKILDLTLYIPRTLSRLRSP